VRFERRPWGWYCKLIGFNQFWVKVLCVKPGQRTSAQFHNERDEVHISLAGIQKIPAGVVHRLGPGWYLELATGRPLEADIVRVADDYDRV
jgi:uncharacterized cupin superfamily protein